MKIAFTAKGTNWDAEIDPRFGRTQYILVYDEEKDELKSIDNSEVESHAHGAGPLTSKKIFEAAPNVLITGNGPGGNASEILKKIDLKIYVNASGKSVKEAYLAYKANELDLF